MRLPVVTSVSHRSCFRACPALLALGFGFVALTHAESIDSTQTQALDSAAHALDSLRGEAIASWNFDEGVGDTLHDSSGHGHHGVIHGANWVKGVQGQGLKFNGQAWVEIPGDSNLNVKSFTFSIWLYQSGNGVRAPLMEFQKPNELVGIHLWANCQGWSQDLPGSFYANLRASDASTSQSGSYRERNLLHTEMGTAPGGRWNHLALTFDSSSGTARIFLNGKKQAEQVLARFQPRTSGSLFLGIRSRTSSDWDAGMGLVGSLDQGDLFNRALSPSEIVTLYGRIPEDPKTLHLGIKTHYAKAGDTLWVPLYLSSDGKDSISSLQFQFNIDTTVASLLDLKIDTVLAPNWKAVDWNKQSQSKVSMAFAGTQRITGPEEGEFARLKILVAAQAKTGASTMMTLTDISADEGRHVLISHTPGRIFVTNPNILYGDVNDDKEVDSTDARLILQCVVGHLKLPHRDFPNFLIAVADVSGNGSITSFDAALVLQYGLGLRSDFPIAQTGLAKRAAAVSQANLRLLAPTRVSGQTFRYRIEGDQLAGLIAGELNLATAPEVLGVQRVASGMTGVRVSHRFDLVAHRLEMALAGNRKQVDGKVGFIEIEAEHAEGYSGNGLTLESAYLNEGKIEVAGVNSVPSSRLAIGNSDSRQGIGAIALQQGRQWLFEIPEDQIRHWEVRDLKGHVLFQETLTNPAAKVLGLSKHFPAGLSLIRLTGMHGSHNLTLYSGKP